MRTLQWVGGISLAGLVLFGGCSCGEELPISLPDLLPKVGVGGNAGSTENQADESKGGTKSTGAGGSRVSVGGSESGEGGDSPRGGAGNEDAAGGRTNGAGGSGEPEETGGARAVGGQANAGSNVAGSNVAGSVGQGGSNRGGDNAPGNGGTDSPQAGSGGDTPRTDAGTQPPPDTSCKLTTGEPCELSVAFSSQAGDIAGLTLTTCPDGPDRSTGVCMGYGNLSNPQWTVASDGRSLEGTVGVRAPDIVARVQKTLLGFPITMTCHLSVGGSDYVPVPVRITLPDGMSASDFLPGCTAVSDPQIALLAALPFSVSGDSGCPAAATLAQDNGGMATLEQGVQTLIAGALTQQVCKNP